MWKHVLRFIVCLAMFQFCVAGAGAVPYTFRDLSTLGVQGAMEATNSKMTTSLRSGYVSKSDASDVGTRKAPSPESRSGVFHVTVYGAKGDAVADDTAAFQAALDAAGAKEGGIVFVPAGRYKIRTHLTIPAHVTLEGIWKGPGSFSENKGTTLLAYEGKGNPDGPPFIALNGDNATLKGVTIYYPKQLKQGTAPLPYPWTIRRTEGEGVSVIDVMLVNPYQAVDLTMAHRHFVRNLYGHPLYKGIYVDQCYDVGRIENVHFWPFSTVPWSYSGLNKWINDNAVAFVLGRTDWEYVFNTFCFGYKIGYQFVQTPSGGCNGNFLGIGADNCVNAVQVEGCAPWGLLITNGEFVGDVGPDANGILISDTNSGTVSLQNCSFWGPSNRIATIGGTGCATFSGCVFRDWDKNGTCQHAIRCAGGRLVVSGCHFDADKNDVEITSGARAAAVIGNIGKGGFQVVNPLDSAKFEVAHNVSE